MGKIKLNVALRKFYDYVRYDLKEIAFPSSLPNPPGYKPPRQPTWKERWGFLKKAARLYAASWVRDIGPDLRPEDYKKDEDDGHKSKDGEKEPSAWEDLAVAARGGMETFKPALQRVYMMRTASYTEALRSFIQGYQEGIKQVMDEKDKKKDDENDAAKKSGN